MNDTQWELLKQGIEKRRLYLRRKLKNLTELEKQSTHKRGRRPHNPTYARALRGGMLSELCTINAFMVQIERGKFDIDRIYNIEDDTDDL